VKNIRLTLKQGERMVIVGASGCGKTTLLKSIAGLHPIKEGGIWFKQEQVKDPSEQLVPGHPLIKLVNQDFDLNSHHSVEENIRIKLLKYDSAYKQNRIDELLKLTELTPFKDFKAKNLSGGQKQRLAIARALADEPELLLLDEPFNQLDYHLKRKIESYILDYVERHRISLILVSHNGEESMRWANQIAFMQNGKIKRFDTPAKFYNHPTNKYEANFFGKLNTILIDRKELSFRPHHFSLTAKRGYIKLETKLISKINNGWYVDYQFKYGKRLFSIYSQHSLKDVNIIWVKPILFK